MNNETPVITGTHTSDTAPWDSYADELTPEIKDPALKAAVDEYGARPYHERTSQQNIEEEHRQKELSREASREYQWLKEDDFADEEARLIDPMHSSELLKRLRAMGLRCWYGGMYWRGLIHLFVQRAETLEPEPATSVQYGYMPAFSVVRFDSHGVPLDFKYKGYWTVLVDLILKGFATEEQIVLAFGIPKGPAGLRHRKMLYNIRNKV